MNIIPGKKICLNCYKELSKDLKNYEEQFKICIDPFQKHRIPVKDPLCCLEQESIDYLTSVCKLKISSENKICKCCNDQLRSDILSYKKFSETTSVNFLTNTTSQQGSTNSNTSKKRSLSKMLDTFDIPPFKRIELTDNRTVKEGVAILQNIVNQVSVKFEMAHEVKMPKFENIERMSNESSWFKNIVSNIQAKYNASLTKFDEKIALLTLLPEDWKLVQINKYFQCTTYMFNESRKLRETTDDSNSSICSGSKECIKIKISDQSSVVVQKRMMLYDLKDLYNNWLSDTSYSHVPCLAFFCQLKPKQCFFAGEPGTHNICVCQIHQNVKLKLSALKIDLSYKEVMEASVCSIENKNCMLRKCNKCLTTDLVYQFLSNGIDIDKMKNVITHTSWTSLKTATKDTDNFSTGRLSLVELNEPFHKLLKSISEDIFNMTEHHFVSSKQKQYYAECRKHLDRDIGVLRMDFAENYSFIAQDSIQGFYFNNTQASLFTAVLYYKNNTNNDDVILCKSFCVISDSTIHKAYSIHLFQETILKKIKTTFPWIKNLIYYSDGAPTQFKNK